MDFFEKLRRQTAEFFQSVDSNTKLISVLFIFMMIAAFSVAIFVNRKPSFGLLYSNISESSAAEMVRHMDDNNIEYELKNQGKNIYVRKEKVNNVRLLLKAKGLPKDGESIGFEIFDKTNLGVTEFVQNIQHNRALGGELERTISQINGVEGVRVHIVLPEEKLFEKDQNETTATVFVSLRREGSLGVSQVNSIRQLVSTAIEGLKSKSVTVVDNYGNILAAQMDDDASFGMANSRMTVQKGVEDYYTKKVQTLLDSVLGMHKSVVRVDALLDFDAVEETEEKYDPESAVVRTETITSEKASGESVAAKGPPGVQSNTQPGSKAGGSGSTEQSSSNREVINNRYEIDKKIRHFVKSVGDLNKLTVSVFLQQDQVLDKEGNPLVDEDGKTQLSVRTDEQLNMFMDIVKNAMGFDAERGDSVVIKEVPFNKKIPPFMDGLKMSKTSDVNAFIGPAIKFITLVLLILLLSVILRKKISVETEYVGGQPTGRQAMPGEAGAAQRGFAAQQGGGGAGETLSEIQKQGLQMVEKGAYVESEIGKLVDNFPSESEHVIKKWLKEE